MTVRPPKPTPEALSVPLSDWLHQTWYPISELARRCARAEWENAVMREALERIYGLPDGDEGTCRLIASDALEEIDQ